MDAAASVELVLEFVVGLEALQELCGGWPEAQRLQLWQWLLKRELAGIGQAAAMEEARRRWAALRQAAQWFTPQGSAFETALAEPLTLLAGGWHQRLVLQKELAAEEAEWFWLAWEVVQWRQQLAAVGAEWWPVVQEQLVRLGALAWAEQAEKAELPLPERHEAISRALTLLKALEPMHQPLPLWISQREKQLLQFGIEGLVKETPLSVPDLEWAAQWLRVVGHLPEKADGIARSDGLEHMEALVRSLQHGLLAAGLEPSARDLQQRWEARQGWEQIYIRACDALLGGRWEEAYLLLRGQQEIPEWKPPKEVSGEIWTELLMNSCSVSDRRLPALQLVESRSLPRSGHHYLRHLLEQACGEQFSYCEGYQEPGCCRRSPCSVAAYWRYAREHGQPHLRLLKSHDFKLVDATFAPPPAMVRLIQVRRPLELLASWLELEQLTLNRELLQSASIALERVFLYHEAEVLEEAWRVIDERGTVMTDEQAQFWLADKVSYVKAFLQKWLPRARPFPFGDRVSGGTYVLRYSDLECSALILQALGLKSAQERPLPVFATRHLDVTVRRSARVTTLIQTQLDALDQADAEIHGQLPALADGSTVDFQK
jgi:hypothetical protein